MIRVIMYLVDLIEIDKLECVKINIKQICYFYLLIKSEIVNLLFLFILYIFMIIVQFLNVYKFMVYNYIYL